MTLEILCINKDDRQSPYERILRVGGKNVNGSDWRKTQAEVIRAIESGDEFFVSKGGSQVKVIVAVSHYGNKYIKTEKDTEEQNNLLSLPECS